jgi:hypothetical protein
VIRRFPWRSRVRGRCRPIGGYGTNRWALLRWAQTGQSFTPGPRQSGVRIGQRGLSRSERIAHFGLSPRPEGAAPAQRNSAANRISSSRSVSSPASALDRPTHRCRIIETKGESYRLHHAKSRTRSTKHQAVVATLKTPTADLTINQRAVAFDDHALSDWKSVHTDELADRANIDGGRARKENPRRKK